MKPITDRQRDILRLLSEQGWPSSLTPAEIAWGLRLTGPRRHGRFNNGRGNWTGHMNPAQRIISSLNGLRKRGYVDFGRRRDGLSGTAYYITSEGRKALEEE